jgi:predicted esterase
MKTEEIIFLLHGYGEEGSKIHHQLKSVLPTDALIVAPNGPFLIPERTETGYRAGYSWYFYEPVSDSYIVDMTAAVGVLKELHTKLDSKGELPVTIIGFSQGGYLAPFVGQTFGATTQGVIRINYKFLNDKLEALPKFQMDLIQGEKDEVVNLEQVRGSFQKLQARGVRGGFHPVPELGHRIRPSALEVLSRVLGARTAIRR